MIRVKLEKKEEMIEVIKKKKILKGRKEKIQDDWTWKERTMQWKLEDLAWEERKKGNTAWVRYGKIWKEGRYWRWDGDEERLKEEREERGGSRGEEKAYKIMEEEK